MEITSTQALWFLPAVFPIGIYVAWNDMAYMKIPNIAVYALVVSFAVLGLFALPIEEWAFRWLHLVVILVAGIILNAAGSLGAGDAKFAAAAAPYIALGDVVVALYLFAGCLLVGYVTHRIARHTPIRRLVPQWESWRTGKRFPMGYPLAATLILYLASPFVAA
jgi:prepilin peptidase CpaA